MAVVTRDEVVAELKKKKPKNNLNQRIKKLTESVLVNEVIKGDKKTGSWNIIGKCNPDIVALGYDQKELKSALEKYISDAGLKIKRHRRSILPRPGAFTSVEPPLL